ncbi:hypothetical protein AVEN_191408-1, partial [Araneus ventricosus]
ARWQPLTPHQDENVKNQLLKAHWDVLVIRRLKDLFAMTRDSKTVGYAAQLR